MERSGIVYIDVGGWGASSGQHPVEAYWDADDEGSRAEEGFDRVADAIEWGRARSDLVLIRLSGDEADLYSAGQRRATRELPEFGGTDLTPYPEWPPSDWSE